MRKYTVGVRIRPDVNDYRVYDRTLTIRADNADNAESEAMARYPETADVEILFIEGNQCD